MKKCCDICHSSFGKLQQKKKYQQCKFCGTFFVIRVPSKEKIITSLNAWAKGIVQQDYSISPLSKVVHRRLKTVYGFFQKRHSLIDVGCGRIEFLLYAKKLGFLVSGLDIAEPIIKQLHDSHIPAFTSLSQISDETFDIVTNFDVIEHTTNPRNFLKEINRITKKNGTLYLSTPNAASISARLLGESWWVFGPKGHYTLFSPVSIRVLLDQFGFSIISMETNTITQWFHSGSVILNKVGNKIVYSLLYPFLPYLFQHGFGDNIEVIAKKIR